ncbi:MAG: tRNA 2-thiouridine(34) synthase MnmA [Actinobacteria bacterium]|nr:tRNA 2-thiouridine(34) synthase MnmA [Actinomycetota bacterium]
MPFDEFNSPFQDHAISPRGRGLPVGAVVGGAGGSLCGDILSIGVTLDRGRVTSIGFEADGCAALTAAASVVVEIVNERTLLEAATVGRDRISSELGGLSAERVHAAVLAEEALHRALGLFVGQKQVFVEPAQDRVLIAMSGGVDSAVAAQLLLERGSEPVAVTLQLWDDPATDGTASCCSPQAVAAARRLAHQMGMPHFTLDLRDEFRGGVVDPYIEAFAHGLTPNPCVGCNGHVRFGVLDDLRGKLGAATLATGHYARIERDDDGPLLAAAADRNKDQTYMLAAVDPQLLETLEFPLAEITKPEVRELAAAAGLTVADKPESQDLCFLAGTDRDAFLRRHGGRGDRPGEIIDVHGHAVGRHRGAHRFTVGQRRGLGIAAPQPLYVLDVDNAANAVTVGTREELATARVRVIGVRLLREGKRVDRVKLRYRNDPIPCTVAGEPSVGRHRELELLLHDPVEGAAPGQIACLMQGDRVAGWATIARSRTDSIGSARDSVSERAKLHA